MQKYLHEFLFEKNMKQMTVELLTQILTSEIQEEMSKLCMYTNIFCGSHKPCL